MTAHGSSPSVRRFGAPLVVIAPTLAVVWWAFPDGLTIWRTVAIATAWAGCGLLVANLVLVVREPHVARLLGGLESMYQWHHRSGLLAYVLLLCHPLALAFDDWLEMPQLAWQALAPWLQSWPVWLGWLALLLFMLGLSSTFALHLPYRRWRGFHFMLGLGVLLGLAHVYSLLGGENPLVFLIFVALLALNGRIYFSDLGVNAYPYQVTKVVHQASGMIEARLHPRAGSMSVSPGQFILAAFGDGSHYHGCGEYHPFTVSSIEADGDLRVSIKALGPCSQRIQQLEPGVQVRLQGPFGTFLEQAPSTPQLWVAGGIGITPFIAALRAHPCPQPTTLLYLFRSEADAAFFSELNATANTDPLFELLPHSSDKGRPDFAEILPKISGLSAREVYICGPLPMVETLMPILRQGGVAASAIHHERFDFR